MEEGDDGAELERQRKSSFCTMVDVDFIRCHNLIFAFESH